MLALAIAPVSITFDVKPFALLFPLSEFLGGTVNFTLINAFFVPI